MQDTRSRTGPGRPPRTEGIRTQAARRAKEAITVLAEVANDASAPADVRVEAATVLLAHATQPAAPQKAQ